MNRIRKGDEVIVLAGKDRGKRGAVLSCVGDDKVIVDGLNRVKKHVKPNPVKGVVGGVVDKSMPLHVSNVALFNSATQRADRVGFKVLADGTKVRIFKSSGETVGA